MAKPKKQKHPNETPRLKFPYVKKDVSKEEFDAAVEAVRIAWRNDQTSARDFGWKLLKLRKCMNTHGQFTKWLRTNSIDQNRASYCMRVAQGLVKKAAARKDDDDPLQANIQRQLSEMYKLASQKMLTPDAMSVHAMEVMHSICARAGKMSGWPVQNPKDENIAPLLSALRTALDNYLDVLFDAHTLAENGDGLEKVAERKKAKAAEASGSGS